MQTPPAPSPSPLRVTILGSGTSHGVPVIACSCAVCLSPDPRDKRTRSSIYVEDGAFSFLVDTTPELRLQCLANRVTRVSAVLFTHPHADHIFGFDDLRVFCGQNEKEGVLEGGRLPVYGSALTLAMLQNIYPYAFDLTAKPVGYVLVRAEPFDSRHSFPLGTLTVSPLEVTHGRMLTHGFLFERGGRKLLAYIPDCKTLSPRAAQLLQGVETLILDGLRDQPHPTHMTIQEALATARSVGARRTFLTHLTHHKSHVEREAELPEGCSVAYDGLQLTLD